MARMLQLLFSGYEAIVRTPAMEGARCLHEGIKRDQEKGTHVASMRTMQGPILYRGQDRQGSLWLEGQVLSLLWG